MRQQMAVLSDSIGKPSEHNLTAYRGTVGSLVDAMRNDLTRAGVPDTGAFGALEDLITRDLEGGPGSTSGPDTDQLGEHLARMDRLIGLYRERMRLAQR